LYVPINLADAARSNLPTDHLFLCFASHPCAKVFCTRFSIPFRHCVAWRSQPNTLQKVLAAPRGLRCPLGSSVRYEGDDKKSLERQSPARRSQSTALLAQLWRCKPSIARAMLNIAEHCICADEHARAYSTTSWGQIWHSIHCKDMSGISVHFGVIGAKKAN